MITNELVSVITPAYNSGFYLADAIRSVLAQSYSNWEMLIVDDYSADNTADVARSFTDSRIRYLRNEQNRGSAFSRNRALQEAQGRYIAFLDADDMWLPDKLEKQLAYMQSAGCAFCYSNYSIINQAGKHIGKDIICPNSMTYSAYLKDTAIGCLTVIIDRKLTGDFRFPSIRTSQDMALWLSLLKQGYEARNQGDVTAYYRVFSGSSTSNKLRAATDVWRVYRNIEHLSLPYAIYCFCGYAYHAIKKRL